MTCLLIDDDLDDQDIFRLCLSEVRPDVYMMVANNGLEALKLLQQESGFVPHVIFLDINMPKMNGLECLQELKQIGRLTGTCIYVYSTTSEDSVVKRTQELGASDYIIKPTKTDKLKEILEHIFATCQSRTH